MICVARYVQWETSAILLRVRSGDPGVGVDIGAALASGSVDGIVVGLDSKAAKLECSDGEFCWGGECPFDVSIITKHTIVDTF